MTCEPYQQATAEPDDHAALEPRYRAAVWVFYAIALVTATVEALIVHGIRDAAGVLGWPVALGGWAAWGIFVVGGLLFGLIELRLTDVNARMRDPLLRLCCWAFPRFGAVGFVADAALFGGAPGTAVAAKVAVVRRPVPLVALAAVVFASVWVPLYIWIWP